VSDIDYNALGSGGGGEPPDGVYRATLIRAKLVETANGWRMVTEWQVGGLTPYYWATWFGFEGPRMAFTQEFLDGLGIDRAQITDDVAFEAALDDACGRDYTVRTSAWSGGINVYPEAAVENPQTSLDDVPIDTDGLPEVSQPTPGVPVLGPDEKIPF
jgi:hypothetical protein